MNKEEALKKVTEGEGDFHVFTEEEHKTFLNNLKDTEVFKQQIDTRVSEIYKGLDDDVAGVLGKAKPHDVKTYDFIKSEMKTLLDSTNELKTKNDELEKAVKDKSGDEALKLLKSENDALLKKHQKFKEEADQKYQDLLTQGERMRVTNEFDRSLTGLKFKTDIPEDVRNVMIDSAKNKLADNAQFVEGKLVFMDTEGKILRDENLNVLSAADILKGELKSIVDEGRKQEGVKIGDPKIDEKEGKLDVTLSIPDSVKTNADLLTHLLDVGLKRGTDEFKAAYAKYSEGLIKV
jgi:membrane-associated HD superfamily phosphohydrolase